MNDASQPVDPGYAFNREWSIESVNFSRYPALTRNWVDSQELLTRIKDLFDSEPPDPRVRTIAAAGSLGRMEAAKGISDGDLIVVLREDIKAGSQDAVEAYDAVWKQLESLREDFDKPKPTGLFGEPTTQAQLLNEMGDAKELLNVFGRRLLLLLETQPVYCEQEYDALINAVLERYAEGYVKNDSKKEWTLLINDLIRYFRSLAVNYQWDFERDKDKWLLRNIKLRHSRTVMYSGLLFLLGEASKERKNKVDWLKDKLAYTPLERLAWVYQENSDWSFFRVAGCYNTFLNALNKPELRQKFNIDPDEDKTEYARRYEIPEFSALKANSDALSAELLRFVLARRGGWTERFFEYLIF